MNSPTLAVGLRAEERLLLCCARTGLDEESAGQVRELLQTSIDWEFLTRLAHQHGVIPLLFTSLSSACQDLLPGPVLEELRTQCFANAGRNLFLTGELLRQLGILEAHGIRAVPFKGPVLADSFYGNLSLRQFSDLDILVPLPQIEQANCLLKTEDYQLHQSWLERSYGPREAARLAPWCSHNYVLTRSDGKVVIELHWRLTPPYFDLALDPWQMDNCLHQVNLAGKPVWSFRPEELLLYLCVHGAKHRWERLSWICDVAEGIRNTRRLEWDRLLDEADKLGCKRMLALGLVLAKTLLGAAIPEEVSRRVESAAAVQGLVSDVCQRLFREVDASPSFLDRAVTVEDISFSSVGFHLRARERWRDRVPYCLYVLYFLLTPTRTEQSFRLRIWSTITSRLRGDSGTAR